MSGCGALGLFGTSDLSALEVSGRYRFTEFVMAPTSGAVKDANLLRDVLGTGVVLNLDLGGQASLERVTDGAVEEVLSRGTYEINGRSVRLEFEDEARLDGIYMPSTLTFEGGDSKLRAEVFLSGVNLEEIDDDYSGVTRADVQLRIRLRKL